MGDVDFLSGLGDQDRDDEDEEGDEDKDAEGLDWARSKKSLALFLVDCSPPMFSECEIKVEKFPTVQLRNSDQLEDSKKFFTFKNRFSYAINEISKFCRSQVRRATADRFGVVFFNVDEDKKGVKVFLELNQPNVKFIKALDEVSRSDDQKKIPKSASKLFDESGNSHLQLGIEECKQQLFQDKNDKDAKKAIYVLTWLDDPLGGTKGRELRKASCLKSVGDCKESQIRVAVVPLAVNDDQVLPGDSSTEPADGEAFYIGRFYEELSNAAYLPSESLADSEGDGEKVDVATQLIDRRVTNLEQEVLGVLNPRSMASINWIISTNPRVEMAVKLYALTMEAKIKSHVWLDQRNNKRVKVMTQRSCKGTGQLLLESQIEKYYPYGRTEIVITDEEMKQVKSMDMEKGIHLLGFKPRSSLRCEDNLRAPYFIYPDEKALVGSTMTFTAFWKGMIEQDRIAICAMRSRSNVAPRLVALVAARERRDDDGRRILAPDGMHVVNLPFSDDIRSIPPHPTVDDVPEEAIAAAEKIMEHFQMCGCRDFENPQLFRHFKHLEAISLEEKVEEEELAAVEACIIPDPEEFSSDEVKQMFQDFKNAIDPEYDSKIMQGGGKAAGSAKRKREPKAEPGPADANLVDIVNSGGLEKLTVEKLKEHCRTLGLTVGGKKADLIQRIVDKVKQD